MNYSVLFAHFPKITFPRYQKLLQYFSDLEQAWESSAFNLIKAGWDEVTSTDFVTWKNEVSIEKIFTILENEKIKIIMYGDPDFPTLLKEISNPPLALFVRGMLPPTSTTPLAIVGTRRPSTYGKQVCQELIQKLIPYHITIVSGLALGIDGIAHETALEAKGITVAVLGSGVDETSVYPRTNVYLAQKIISQGGALISEYPPGFLPTTYSFPARNRIIAGLTQGTLILEAPEESGALITAKCALEYNREVMAIPHPITSNFGSGCNNLIRLGATLIRSEEDILEALNITHLKPKKTLQEITFASAAEATIFTALSTQPKHIDLIIKETQLESSLVNSTLVLMEIKGIIKHRGGMQYSVS
jgi:DNA processing protein